MITGSQEKDWKPSARDVMRDADRIVTSAGRDFDIDPQDIQLLHGRWAVRMPATAIILANADSAQAGSDRTESPSGKSPMIESLYRQLTPWFTEVIVCVSDRVKYTLHDVTVIRDEVAGERSLMNIASALRASANEVNFVVGCDATRIDGHLVRSMLRQAVDCDAVVPATCPAEDEPACAVYRKSVIPVIEATVQAGSNRTVDVLDRCRVKRVALRLEFDTPTCSEGSSRAPLSD